LGEPTLPALDRIGSVAAVLVPGCGLGL